jgi:hypothetical protein
MNSETNMTGIKLTERIRYLHCEDPDGNHGVLILLGNKRHPTKVMEVNDTADFRFAFKNLKVAEETQNELDLALYAPRQLGYV